MKAVFIIPPRHRLLPITSEQEERQTILGRYKR